MFGSSWQLKKKEDEKACQIKIGRDKMWQHKIKLKKENIIQITSEAGKKSMKRSADA